MTPSKVTQSKVTPSDRLVLDSHVFLWWRSEPDRLTAEARKAIASADIVFVSVVTAWELAIKTALGRLRLPESVEAGVVASNFEKLGLTFTHTEAVATLPQHHRDPFDRMLVAQAITENLVLVSRDRALEAYEARIIWA